MHDEYVEMFSVICRTPPATKIRKKTKRHVFSVTQEDDELCRSLQAARITQLYRYKRETDFYDTACNGMLSLSPLCARRWRKNMYTSYKKYSVSRNHTQSRVRAVCASAREHEYARRNIGMGFRVPAKTNLETFPYR